MKTRAETAAVFSEGMRVKVTEDVVVFHAPGSAKTGLNIKVRKICVQDCGMCATTHPCAAAFVGVRVCELCGVKIMALARSDSSECMRSTNTNGLCIFAWINVSRDRDSKVWSCA